MFLLLLVSRLYNDESYINHFVYKSQYTNWLKIKEKGQKKVRKIRLKSEKKIGGLGVMHKKNRFYLVEFGNTSLFLVWLINLLTEKLFQKYKKRGCQERFFFRE